MKKKIVFTILNSISIIMCLTIYNGSTYYSHNNGETFGIMLIIISFLNIIGFLSTHGTGDSLFDIYIKRLKAENLNRIKELQNKK